jgi:hypothetical protein
MDKQKVIDVLNRALENEMGVIVKLLHHSFLVFGPGRAPAPAWPNAGWRRTSGSGGHRRSTHSGLRSLALTYRSFAPRFLRGCLDWGLNFPKRRLLRRRGRLASRGRLEERPRGRKLSGSLRFCNSR